MVSDDLDRVLVCADRAVAAQTPELAGDGACCRGHGSRLFGKRKSCHVVHDADREAVLRLFCGEVLINGKDRSRGGVLGTKAISAADDFCLSAGLAQSGNNVEVEGIAESAGLFGAVKHCDLLGGGGNCLCELCSHERTIEADFDKTDLLALCSHVVNDFFNDVTDRAHCDDHTVSVRIAVVVEELVIGSELVVDLAHVLFHDGGKILIELVASFSVLEEDVTVLGRAAQCGMLGVQGVFAESGNSVHIDHVGEILVVPDRDLLDLVRGTETVKKVEERNTALDGGQVSHSAEIHDLLLVGFCHHGKSGLAASVDVRVVAEDVQRMGGHATSRDVNDAGEKFACDLIHIRNHEKKSLRCRVGRGQSAGGKRAVNGTGRTRFGLHLHHLDGFAENVSGGLAKDVFIGSRPSVGDFRHGGGRSDRVDGRHFGKRIGYVRRRCVAIHGKFLAFDCHVRMTSLKNVGI